MKLSNNFEVKNEIIDDRLKILLNQTYRLLPIREEKKDWVTPLSTLIEELAGMSMLLEDAVPAEWFFSLLCKMKGLLTLEEEDQFINYRRTIFECINIIEKIRGYICQDQTVQESD